MTYDDLARRAAGIMRASSGLPGGNAETAATLERIWEVERGPTRGGYGHFLTRMVETIMFAAYQEGVKDGQRLPFRVADTVSANEGK